MMRRSGRQADASAMVIMPVRFDMRLIMGRTIRMRMLHSVGLRSRHEANNKGSGAGKKGQFRHVYLL
jgi:hypothetical protein